MRKINLIVIHCTATREDVHLSKKQLDDAHKARGFSECGYHYYITRDGVVHSMRPISKIGAHAMGYNGHSIGIAYEGGLDSGGQPCDTRTSWQRHSLQVMVKVLQKDYPGSRVCGHRDLSPDLDGNGHIDPHEWTKMCPCFCVKTDL